MARSEIAKTFQIPVAIRTKYAGHAIRCGLLPGFTREQIQVVGNTSLGGAFLVLNDRSLLAEMQTACALMESIELNLQPGFEDAYIDHLALP